MIEERAKEYETNPGSFVPWKEIRRAEQTNDEIIDFVAKEMSGTLGQQREGRQAPDGRGF
jgi:hypothetical protein